jgi:hypothetical protein
MLTFLPTPGRSCSVHSELLLLVSLLATVFVYLEVPVWNALFFSVAVTSQAAFGTIALTRIFKEVPASLLLLLGPGLILGGALSFALFQLAGRGVPGLVAVVVVEISSVAYVLRMPNWRLLGSQRLWILGQVVGLAVFALTWEFPEFLPVAITFLILGYVTGETFATPRWVKWLTVAIAPIAIIAPLLLRQTYWWMTTDDHQILEVQMRHFTESGILALWGEHDWRRYHWLSVGWGGLLNQLGGAPAIFTTLTRVMPFVYCIALAASLLLLISTLIRTTNWSMALLIPCWAVVGINRFDWSSPSTGGSLSVVAAAVSAGLIVAPTATNRFRRFLLASLFLAVAAVTKLPSLFGTLLFFLTIEVFIFSKKGRSETEAPSTVLQMLIGLVVITPLLYLANITVGGFEIAPVNPQLGSIGDHGAPLTLLLLLFSKFWIVTPLAIFLLLKPMGGHRISVSDVDSLLRMLAPFAVLGLVLEVVIAPINSNGHEYFSSPFYLVTSFSFFTLFKSELALSTLGVAKHHNLLKVFCFLLFGLVWAQLFNVGRISSLLGSRPLNLGDRGPIISYVFSDGRTGVALAVVTLLGLHRILGSAKRLTVILPLLLTLVLLTFAISLPHSISSFRTKVTAGRPTMLFGSPEVQEMGRWLRTSTKKSDIIATNYLRDHAGELSSDYTLAVWSERTFFVLGPRFFIESQSQVMATSTSEEFADTASIESAKILWASGVRWFVVDTTLVSRDNWNERADAVHQIGRFVVLRLRTPN